MENNSTSNRTSGSTNSSNLINSSTSTSNPASVVSPTILVPPPVSSASASSTPTSRQSHKRTFAESDSSSRTERCLCSFSHLWIINYLSSYIDDPNFTCLQSETFSPVNTPYSSTRWSLKLYPRGLNEKQHMNNNIAIFLKYVSGTIATIKAKAEFSVVSRNNELVMLRSTNFHTFSCGNDWGYSEFLDGNYLNSRRNDLLTDDRLRVYVRVILVDEKETSTSDTLHSSHQYNHHHHHHHHHPQASALLPSSLPPRPIGQQQHQVSDTLKTLASTSSSSASSSTASTTTTTTTAMNTNISNPSSTSSAVASGLFLNERERLKSLELLANQIKTLLDDERFTNVLIHVVPKQSEEFKSDDSLKPHRSKRPFVSQRHPLCSSCHCRSEKVKSTSMSNEKIFDCQHRHEQSSSVISKDSDSTNAHDDTRLYQTSTRRTTRSTTSLLSRMAQSSSETNNSSSNSSTLCVELSSDICSSSSIASRSPKRCVCTCHNQDDKDLEITFDIQQSHMKYADQTPLATFRAHKAILTARSSWFASQIRLNNLNGTHHSYRSPPINIYIDDLESPTVHAMLIYIYTGRLPTSNDEIYNNLNPIDLFRAAVKHDLNELRDLTKSAMLEVLKVDNAIEMLEVSDQANDILLKQQVLAFIRSNAASVSKKKNWLNLAKNNPDLIIDAFRSLVTPTVTSTAMSKHDNKNNPALNNNNLNHYHHSTTLTTTIKYSKCD